MAEPADIPAWIALFLGLYSLAAAVGEFRAPGGWSMMLRDIEKSHGLRFVTGLVCIALGAAIYLVSPWRPGDWLAVVVSVLGGLTLVEGLVIMAAGDRFIRFARMLIGRAGAAWAGFSALFGVALIFIALARL